MDRRFLYHCSPVDLGRRFTSRRQVPRNRDSREPETPRICVCEHVPDCFGAVLFSKGVHVYRSVRELRGIRPVGVWDSMLTLERWVVDPCEFERIDFLHEADVSKLTGAFAHYHVATRKTSNYFIRMSQLVRSWEVLSQMLECCERRFRIVRRMETILREYNASELLSLFRLYDRMGVLEYHDACRAIVWEKSQKSDAGNPVSA